MKRRNVGVRGFEAEQMLGRCWGQCSARSDMLISSRLHLLRSLVKSALLSTRRLGLIAMQRGSLLRERPEEPRERTDPPARFLT